VLAELARREQQQPERSEISRTGVPVFMDAKATGGSAVNTHDARTRESNGDK
jgi:hypothetical protein